MISEKHKCIFIHIPKTAGTTVEKLIWPNEEARTEEELWMGFVKDQHNKYHTGGLQHLMARYVREEVGDKKFNAFYKFSVVRNPWDKTVSQFRYMKQRPDLRSFLGMHRFTSFKKYLKLIQKVDHVHWLPQVKFLFDLNGELLVDKVLSFENFESEIKEVLGRLKLEIKSIPHLNRSKRRDYKSYYSNVTKEMVEEFYKDDIKKFNYKF